MTIEFKPGDKVKKKNGEPFSNGGALEATVDYVEGGYMVYFLETRTWIGADRIEKVENDMKNPFKVGDKVKIKSGWLFGQGKKSDIIESIKPSFEVTLKNSGYIVSIKDVEKVENDMKNITELHDAMLESLKPSFSEMNALKQERPDSDHYHTGDIDVWKFAEANFDYDEVFGFHKIDAIKYLTRFGKKNGRNIRDLEKARAEIDEMIRMETEGK